MRRIAATTLALASLLAARPLAAQETVSVAPAEPMSATAPTFHAGQWGAEFLWSGGLYGIGALKFTSESSAWALDANALAAFHDYVDTEDGYSSLGLSLSLAKRRYRAPTGRVRPFTEIGARVSYQSQHSQSGPNEGTERGFGVGAVAGLGAQIFFARDMSIGARWNATFDVIQNRSYVNGSKVAQTNHYYFDAGNVSVLGALYF